MVNEGIGGQVIIDGFNMFDIITIINKKNRRYIANALDEMEEMGFSKWHLANLQKT